MVTNTEIFYLLGKGNNLKKILISKNLDDSLWYIDYVSHIPAMSRQVFLFLIHIPLLCLCLSCWIPCVLLHFSSKNCFLFKVVGLGVVLVSGWFCFCFCFLFVGQVSVHKKYGINDSRKWSLLSKQERIPGQMLAQAVSGRCLRGTFVTDQPLAMYEFSERDVFPLLRHFWAGNSESSAGLQFISPSRNLSQAVVLRQKYIVHLQKWG